MARLKKRKLFDCSVDAAISVVGGKWKAVILYHLLQCPTIRFGEFRRLLPKITQQMLTTQLRELKSDGVVHREIFLRVPPKVEYSLTPFGKTLDPLIQAMAQWGDAYEKKIEATGE
jgi:DNA-binding HxlR family transcriptional regulator